HPEIARMRSEDGRLRVRQQLQRFASEPGALEEPLRPLVAEPVAQPPAARVVLNEQAQQAPQAQQAQEPSAATARDIPPPLAEKLLDLVAALAGAQAAQAAKPADSADGAALRNELLGLQRDILRRFDEYRGEVHQLREDVRRVSGLPQSPVSPATAGNVVGKLHVDAVRPEDSVSAAGEHDHGDDDEEALSDTSTTVPDRSPRPTGDLLATRMTLDALRSKRRAQTPATDRELGLRLATTLADLQHVHVQRYHSSGAPRSCQVCRLLAHTPGTAPPHSSLPVLSPVSAALGTYVDAMQDEYSVGRQPVGRAPARHHAFTPTKKNKHKHKNQQNESQGDGVRVQDSQAVIALLRQELDALRRRYRRLVDEYSAGDPTDSTGERRRALAAELKHLVDLLDAKAEQIAVLAALHPESPLTLHGKRERRERPRRAFWDNVGSDHSVGAKKHDAEAERALRSANDLQRVLDWYD
ncbi:hypothetical protein IW150_006768, partial [Coemansia sp. RSA 2607]